MNHRVVRSLRLLQLPAMPGKDTQWLRYNPAETGSARRVLKVLEVKQGGRKRDLEVIE